MLSRGSVLRYRLPRTLSAKERERLQSRGLYRECGLGRIAVNPVMLSAERPVFSATLKVANNPTIPAPPAPATLLASLLQRRAALAGDKIQAQEISTAIFRELCQSLDRARAWQGIPDSQALIAPGRSQWGHLKKLASDHRHRPHELWQALFQGDKAMIRTRSGWELETAPDTTLADEFQAICKRHYQHDIDDGALGEIMGHLAVRGLTQDWADAVGGNTRHDQENKE